MFGRVGLRKPRKVKLIEKFRILDDEEFRDFYMSSGAWGSVVVKALRY
jgi:hypothetical protein